MTNQQLGKGRRIIGHERETLGAQLARRYETGASIRALAETSGRSYGFVHRLLSESGVSLRGRGVEHATQETQGLGVADHAADRGGLAVADLVDAQASTLDAFLPERGERASFRGAVAELRKVRDATGYAGRIAGCHAHEP